MHSSSRRVPTGALLLLSSLLLLTAPAHGGIVAGGASHSAAVLPDGSVWVWGANDRGQLGGGTVAPALTPKPVPGLTGVVAVASGDGHLLALTRTGEVWTWGANEAGQLGDGTTEDRLAPLAVLSGAVGIDAGPDFSLAWKADGTLWTWGANDSGQLGDGSVWPSDTPAPITEISGVAQASAGRGHVLALGVDGSIWSWGRNVFGQLGEGTREDHLSPVAVTAVADAAVVVAGAEASYALGSDGSLWAWGANAQGQLGDGTTTMRLAAVAVRVPAAVQAVSVGGGHALARLADGTVWAWGRNHAGQVGNGSPVTCTLPTVLSVGGVAALAAGLEHSLAVTAEGVVWTWGRNTSGQLGDGTTEGRLEPVAISGPGFSWKVGRPVLAPPPDEYDAAQSVRVTTATRGATVQYTEDGSEPDETSASVVSGGTVSIPETTTLKVRAVRSGRAPSDTVGGAYTIHEPDEEAASAGDSAPEKGDELAEAAVAAVGEEAMVPMMLTLTSSPAITAGERHSLALLGDASAWAWGDGGHGRLGDGTTTARHYPVSVLGDVAALSAGTQHGLALKTDGTVWGWGGNSNGQVGDGTTTQRNSPVAVTGLSDIVAISAGYYFSLALEDDGTVWAWGDNYYGELGLGDRTDRSSPQVVLTGVDAVVAGGWHVLAIKSDGSVWTWGRNQDGQLGDGVSSTYRLSPAAVSGLGGVVEVAAGGFHSFARDSSGDVYAWGKNGNGRLGDGTTTTRKAPVLISALSGVVDLEAGDAHSLAVLSGGTLLAWGYNYYGQLGDGTNQERRTPVTVPGLTGIVSAAGGDLHSLALASDGTVWAWGLNNTGQLGDGTTVQHLSPVKISEAGAWKVATPSLNPRGGSYTAERDVVVTVVSAHDTIHYTRNGVDPTQSDPQVVSGGIVEVDESQTLKVAAFAAGTPPSNVAVEVYALTVATPTLSPGGATYNTPQTVTISCSVPGVTIRYTRDGSNPTTGSDLYTGPILVDATQTVKARAWRTGWTESAVRTAQYTMAVAAPTLTPGGGSYAAAQQVVISSVTPDITLRFTTNGVEPTETTGQVIVSGSSVLVDRSLTLRVKGWRSGWTPSPTTTANYFIPQGSVEAPALSPPPGSYTAAQTVSLTTNTPGAMIRYTLDGTPPDSSSPPYEAPLSVDSTTTVSAQAFRSGWSPSPTTSGTYTITDGAVARPVISPWGGSHAVGREVTVSVATVGATIHYTTDGTEPTESDDTIASGASLTLVRSARVQARAFKAGLDPSLVATADFDLVGAIVGGAKHTLLLAGDGTLWAWGDNGHGQIGDGTTVRRTTPVLVSALSPSVEVVAIATGEGHNLVLSADGTIWGWGNNSRGQLGNNQRKSVQTTPVQVLEAGTGLPLDDVIAISGGAKHSLALRTDGTVWIWGDDSYGQLGDAAPGGYRLTAAQLPGLTGVTAISSGGFHSLALKTDGAGAGGLWTWGRNGNGQLGDGTVENRSSPLQVLEDVRLICGAAFHSLALKVDGTLWGAGLNDRGQLGDGTTDDRSTFGSALLGVSGVAKLTASGVHSLALLSDGRVWATGYNGQGPLGDGTSVNKTTPVRTVWLEDVVDLAAGQFVPSIYIGTNTHSAALTADGQVWTWGGNYYGQLGTGGGGNDAVYRPQPLPDLQGSDQSWPLGDADQDGLTNAEELELGSDPYDPDTNDDGLLDSVAVRSGLSATDPDMDADGLTNAAEVAQGTDPLRADTDSDGVADAVDCFPLDPSRSTCPTPTPGDVTPPSMTLTEPTNAVLVSTDPP